jgi:hypothetical protein
MSCHNSCHLLSRMILSSKFTDSYQKLSVCGLGKCLWLTSDIPNATQKKSWGSRYLAETPMSRTKWSLLPRLPFIYTRSILPPCIHWLVGFPSWLRCDCSFWKSCNITRNCRSCGGGGGFPGVHPYRFPCEKKLGDVVHFPLSTRNSTYPIATSTLVSIRKDFYDTLPLKPTCSISKILAKKLCEDLRSQKADKIS